MIYELNFLQTLGQVLIQCILINEFERFYRDGEYKIWSIFD